MNAILLLVLAAAAEEPRILGLPFSFDFGSLAPNCRSYIPYSYSPDQSHSSWATEAVNSISLRNCYQTHGALSNSTVLSIQFMNDCYPGGVQNGGLTRLMWDFLNATFVPNVSDSLECDLYAAQSSRIKTFRQYRGVPAIQMAILQGGPVQTCFDLYEDLEQFTSGVYVHSWGAYEQYACFVLTGWSGSAWQVANFWSTQYPNSFFVQFGQCGIEDDVWGGVPDLSLLD